MVERMTSITNWEDNFFLVWGYTITTFPEGKNILVQ